MVFHQIQCPNCFTEYAISDEQYQTSGSMIRCGICRGQYDGIVLSESATKPAFDPREVFIEPSLDSQGDNDDTLDLQLPGEPEHVNHKTPPALNENEVELFSSNEDDLDIETTSVTISETHFAADFETNSDKTPEIEIFDELDTNPNAHDISDELSTSEILRNLRKRSANYSLESKTNSNSIEDDISISIEPKLENESPKQSFSDQASFEQQELKIDIEPEPSTLNHDALESHVSLNSHDVLNDHNALKGRDALKDGAAPNKDFSLTKNAIPKIGKALKDDVLIDQVDKLVDEKLLGTEALASKEAAISNEESNAKRPKPRSKKLRTKKPKQEKRKKGSGDNDDGFFLEPRNRRVKKKNSFFGFIGFILKALLLLILLIVLIYQFWLKQFIELPNIDSLPNHPWFDKAEDFVTPHIETAKQQLERHNITLPDRRDLEQLELLSAQTFPHPKQATTVLLKVSFINRATISQPLPWLEMSLTDTEGRLVARRNLSPDDYIYNNRTNLEIGPNELKKITIELLSFPKSATGYEIKLLSN